MPSVGLVPALAIIAGSFCGLHVQLSSRPLLIALTALCLAAGVAWHYQRHRLTLVALIAGFWTAAFLLSSDARDRALHSTLRTALEAEYGGFAIETLGPAGRHDPIATTVVLTEDAAVRDGFASVRGVVKSVMLRGEQRAIDGGVALSIGGGDLASHVRRWRAGRTIEAPIVFRRPTRYLNDGVADFERELAVDGTTLLGSVKSGLLVEVRLPGSVAEEAAADVRAYVRDVVTRWIAPHSAISAAIVAAVLIGDRTGIPDEVRDRLQAAGTYHVIAISGGNIAVLVAIVIGISSIAGASGRPAAIVSIAILLIYAQVVAAGPSVWRATLMALIHLTARVLDHRTPMWQAAAVAAAAMLVVRPLDLEDPGFLLTFGATAALLEVARRANPSGRQSRVLRWIAVSLLASVAVEVALAPVGASTFSRVTVAGVVLNLLAVPLMGVVQAAGIAATLFDAVNTSASIPGWTAHLAASAIVESARLVEVAPWLTKRVPPPALVMVVLYYAALATMLMMRGKPRIVGGVVLAIVSAGVAAGVGPWSWRNAVPGLRLTVFDVGQGESLLLQSGGAAVLIDAGGAPFGGGGLDIGARVVAPALWSRGVSRLDALLLTHGDPDHIGGAASVLDVFTPPRLWVGVPVPRHQPVRDLIERARLARASIHERRVGERMDLGAARVRVLHPPQPDWERQQVRNDDSVVLEVLYGDVALLLTGDISADVEREILPQLTPARIRVLKVAHHGSRTSTSRELLDAWRPQIAVISCGRGNTFGHPAPDVMRRLEATGAAIFRTDRHGQITIETSGRGVRVRSFTGETYGLN